MPAHKYLSNRIGLSHFSGDFRFDFSKLVLCQLNDYSVTGLTSAHYARFHLFDEILSLSQTAKEIKLKRNLSKATASLAL